MTGTYQFSVQILCTVVNCVVGWAGDEKRRSQHQESTSQPIEETANQWAGIYRFILGRTDEARGLIALSS